MPTGHPHESAPTRLYVGHRLVTDRADQGKAVGGQGQDERESFGGEGVATSSWGGLSQQGTLACGMNSPLILAALAHFLLLFLCYNDMTLTRAQAQGQEAPQSG